MENASSKSLLNLLFSLSFSPSPFGSKNNTWADSKTVFVVLAQLVVDNNYDDNGILASITLPTADGIKCDYHLPFKNGK